jgi:hypothetical protein
MNKRLFATKRFWLFAYYIEIGMSALWPWSHFKLHKPRYNDHRNGFYRHLVWGKFSLIVSQPQYETVTLCTGCDEEMGSVSFGDECLSHCESCQSVEGDTYEISQWEYENRT